MMMMMVVVVVWPTIVTRTAKGRQAVYFRRKVHSKTHKNA